MALDRIINCYELGVETPINSIGGNARPITVIRAEDGVSCTAGAQNIFFPWWHIIHTIHEIRSFCFCKHTGYIRVGSEAVSYENLRYPNSSIEGLSRLNGPDTQIDTMQGNIFAAILVRADLGSVMAIENLRNNPNGFHPNTSFFEIDTLEINPPGEDKIKRLWNAKRRYSQRRNLKEPFRNSLNRFREWYLAQYKVVPTCHYCGIPEPYIQIMYWDKRQTRRPDTRLKLEIERLNSNRNYSEDNCVLACMACNNAKSDIFTQEEFESIGKLIRDIWTKDLSCDLL